MCVKRCRFQWIASVPSPNFRAPIGPNILVMSMMVTSYARFYLIMFLKCPLFARFVHPKLFLEVKATWMVKKPCPTAQNPR